MPLSPLLYISETLHRMFHCNRARARARRIKIEKKTRYAVAVATQSYDATRNAGSSNRRFIENEHFIQLSSFVYYILLLSLYL